MALSSLLNAVQSWVAHPLMLPTFVIGATILFLVQQHVGQKRYQRLKKQQERMKLREVPLFKPRALKQHIHRDYKNSSGNGNNSTLVQPCDESQGSDPKAQLVGYDPSDAPFYQTGEMAEVKIRQAEKGIAAMKPMTVIELFEKAAARGLSKDNLALVAAAPDNRTWTWQEYYDNAVVVARAFATLGVTPGSSVNVVGFNAPEWHLSEMGAILLGAKAAGIYTTNGPEACKYIAEHSKAVVVVCDGEEQLRKFMEIRDELPDLAAVVVWGCDEVPKGCEGNPQCKTLTWDQLNQLGKENSTGKANEAVNRASKSIAPGHPCTLIYTSGTTGNPKAVIISHDNATWTSLLVWSNIIGDEPIPEGENCNLVSYLPLSHIAAQMVDVFAPIVMAAVLETSPTIYFADSGALKGTLLNTLLLARPSFFFGVPRVWIKFKEAMEKKSAQNSPLKKMLIKWAKSQGEAHLKAMQNSGRRRGLQSPLLFPIAKILLDKAKAAIGLDRCRSAATGAAPINPDVLTFFGRLNIPVLELYGMSESTGPHTVAFFDPINRRGFEIGTCGPPLAGVELLIDNDPSRDKPGEGEICLRGRHIMSGYMKDEAKTRETMDDNGWLHSGDVGSVDEDGLLRITGRIKELIITEGGENIAPVGPEEKIKSALPAISNAMMIGDKRKYCTVLITLKCKVDGEGKPTNELVDEAAQLSSSRTVEEAQKDDAIKKMIQRAIDEYNKVAVSRAQHIQKFQIVPEFSVHGGELGPTLKLKRQEVAKQHADAINAMYA